MALLLRIDNLDRLPDGGPVSFELDRRGIDIGRDSYLDWTLPDPERFISGKHCEIRYRDGGYWLHDVSTNGTTINGRPGRLTEPYRLQDGDRIHIGQYIVAVALQGEASAPPAAVATPFGGNVWGDVPDAAAAVDRREFAARARPASDGPRGPADLPEEDIGWSIGEVTPGVTAPEDVWGAPPAERETGPDEWGWTPAAESRAEPAAAPREQAEPRTAPDRRDAAVPPPADEGADDPFAAAMPPAQAAAEAPYGVEAQPASPEASPAPSARAEPHEPHEPPAAEPPAVELPPGQTARGVAAPGLAAQWAGGQAPRPVPPPPGVAAQAGAGGFIAAFERGAGMPAGAVAERTDEAFAEELGALLRLMTERLQAMLLARAETKSAIRSSERTMINALENNPLKFSPTPEDAMRIMFGARTRSYLDAMATIESSFGDLQRHQIQTFAAMQQALQALIEDLDPKNIEGATSEDSGLAALVGSRRAKFWDTYVERFRAKSARHERGMIDAFMILFAEMYDRQR